MLPCPITANHGPVRVTQHFGERPEAYIIYHLKGHNGTDITGPVAGVSVPLLSPCAGTVTVAGNKGDYGKCVRINSAAAQDGTISEFTLGHLASIASGLKPGVRVRLGQQLGMMGSTGNSTAPHLHIGLRILDDRYRVLNAGNGFDGFVDPEPYMIFWKTRGPDVVSYPYSPPHS